MPKKCVEPNCSNNQFGGGYCKYHQYLRQDKHKPKRMIRMFSEKREAVNKGQYGPAARQFVKDHPACAIRSPVCTGKATCVNHKKGKATIELLLDEKYWEPSCWPCNNWIESNDAWAREHGHKVSRHAKTK